MDEKQTLSREELRSVAAYQNGILLCILGYLLLLGLQCFLAPDLRIYLALAAIVLSIIATVCVFLLATKVYGTGLGILFGVLTLIPFVGLIVLLIINGKATGVLKNHGIQVGLFGANLTDLE